MYPINKAGLCVWSITPKLLEQSAHHLLWIICTKYFMATLSSVSYHKSVSLQAILKVRGQWEGDVADSETAKWPSSAWQVVLTKHTHIWQLTALWEMSLVSHRHPEEGSIHVHQLQRDVYSPVTTSMQQSQRCLDLFLLHIFSRLGA